MDFKLSQDQQAIRDMVRDFARNEITQILRDKVYLLLLTVGGVGTLVTLAYTLSADIENVQTLVVDRDASQYSHEFVQALANDRFFNLEMVAERDKAEEHLRSDRRSAIVKRSPIRSTHAHRGQRVALQRRQQLFRHVWPLHLDQHFERCDGVQRAALQP